MNIAPGAQVRVNVRLNMRLAPAVESERVCTVQDGVLVTALAAARGGWFHARVLLPEPASYIHLTPPTKA